MRIIRVTVDTLTVEGPLVTATSVTQATGIALTSGIPYEPVAVQRAGNYPAFIRSQIAAKTIPLGVYFHAASFDGRQTAYDALAAVLGPGEHTLEYEDDEANAWALIVTAGPLLATAFLQRATCELTAWNPIAVAV